MKKTLAIVFRFVMFVLAVSPVMAYSETIAVQLKGKAVGFLADVPAADGSQINDAICFRVPMFHVPTGLELGEAFDCLSDVVDDGDGGVTLTDTTIFSFSGNGLLVSHGRVSIRLLQDIESAPASTHITGSVPNADTKNIALAGGNRFEGRTGTVRLSGAVNMSEFNLNPGEPITFDCLFVIKLDGEIVAEGN